MLCDDIKEKQKSLLLFYDEKYFLRKIE